MCNSLEVLRGSKNPKLLQCQHHQLSTYGIGQN
ncbi:RQC domain-containing protein [Microcoleus sp. Pol11C2]